VEYEDVVVTPTSAGALGTLTFDVPQFNPSQGTLNSVELILTPIVGEIGYSVYNSGSAQQVANYAQVSDPHGSLSGYGLEATWSSSETHGQDNVTANPGINNGALPFNSFSITPSSVTVGPSGFIGAEVNALLLTGASSATPSGSSGSSLFYGWYGNVGGNLEVEFSYTDLAAVPEPAGYGFVGGLGALGMLALSVRRNRKQRFAGERRAPARNGRSFFS
jgi:hypothetical protein